VLCCAFVVLFKNSVLVDLCPFLPRKGFSHLSLRYIAALLLLFDWPMAIGPVSPNVKSTKSRSGARKPVSVSPDTKFKRSQSGSFAKKNDCRTRKIKGIMDKATEWLDDLRNDDKLMDFEQWMDDNGHKEVAKANAEKKLEELLVIKSNVKTLEMVPMKLVERFFGKLDASMVPHLGKLRRAPFGHRQGPARAMAWVCHLTAKAALPPDCQHGKIVADTLASMAIPDRGRLLAAILADEEKWESPAGVDWVQACASYCLATEGSEVTITHKLSGKKVKASDCTSCTLTEDHVLVNNDDYMCLAAPLGRTNGNGVVNLAELFCEVHEDLSCDKYEQVRILHQNFYVHAAAIDPTFRHIPLGDRTGVDAMPIPLVSASETGPLAQSNGDVVVVAAPIADIVAIGAQPKRRVQPPPPTEDPRSNIATTAVGNPGKMS